MNAMLALLKREYLENRGAFIYFPVGILVLLALSVLYIVGTANGRIPVQMAALPTGKAFEIGYATISGFWWLYLAVTAFFYFATAFGADRRNNAMFFWKSMPQSDLKILGSKMTAGTTMFPAIVWGFSVATGAVLALAVVLIPWRLGAGTPDLPALVMALVQLSAFALIYYALSLLWFLPFLAWVGALSTAFRRWSIPLSFVAPASLILVENVVAFGHEPRGGYIFAYLTERLQFGFSQDDLEGVFMSGAPAGAYDLTLRLLAHIDWTSMLSGWAFAGIALYLASEYRRRAAP